MKIALTLLVRNEIDIIDAYIRHHLPLVDFLIIMDNCSTDGTYEYLDSIKDDKIILMIQGCQNYNQKLWVSQMVNHAANLKADWVINSDADEFFIGDLRGVIERAHNMGYNQIYPKGSHFRITAVDDFRERNPVKRMLYRDPLSVVYDQDKVIHRTLGFVSVTQGNHWVQTYDIIKPKVLHTNEIRLFHYSVRSWEQFLSKFSDCFNDAKISNMGHIWRERYLVYKNNGISGLKDIFNSIVVPENKLCNYEKDMTLAMEFK